jgi:hypothetical protein
MDSAEEAVGVRRQVYTRGLSLEVQDGSDERGVLVRETVVFLASPGAGLDVVDGAEVASPFGLASDLVELGVLHHHGVDDAKEGFVTRKECGAASKCVALRS